MNYLLKLKNKLPACVLYDHHHLWCPNRGHLLATYQKYKTVVKKKLPSVLIQVELLEIKKYNH